MVLDPARAPAYAAGSLADVLPAVVRSLGMAPPDARTDPFRMPPARRAVVVLVDGLGFDLLQRRAGHAPWLRARLEGATRVGCGFPSTTATSMGSFGTGELPGAHGLLGYEVLDPERGRLLNELSWEDGPDPLRWQPADTIFQRAERAGIAVHRIGPGYFDGSGLTQAALRGGRFHAAEELADRVDAALRASASAPRTLTYLYWGDVDKVGHIHGCESWQWGEALELVDRELQRLADCLPRDTSLTITADHGMVDIPQSDRLDLAYEADLTAGVRLVGGEARAPQLYCVAGSRDDVLASWRERLGSKALVLSREEAIARGWFGPVSTHLVPRIGDVVVAMQESFAVVDSRTMRPALLALLGLHGSLTPDEVAIPVVHVPARASA